MRVVWVVFVKEFLDIVRNRRRFIWMLLSSFVIFPLLFVTPYALLLGRMAEQTVSAITIPAQGLDNAPALAAFLENEKDIKLTPAKDVEKLVRDKEYPVGLIIPEDYETKLAAGESVQVTLVADLRKSMDFTGTRLLVALEEFGDRLRSERLKERGLSEDFLEPLVVEQRNVATATETAGSQLGLLIPGLIISMGLGAGMPVAVASIAGEKKNQTLEPVLFTTVNRFYLVLAKLLAVLGSILFNLLATVLMFAFSALALVFVLYRFYKEDLNTLLNSGTTPQTTPAASVVTPGGYSLDPLAILLFLLAPILIVLFGALIELVISAWARNDEEAYTYMTPLNFLGLIVIFAAFFLDEFVPELWHYGIPIFGTILSMRDLLSNRIDPASLTVMFVSSAVYTALMLALTVWMFHREEVVFRT